MSMCMRVRSCLRTLCVCASTRTWVCPHTHERMHVYVRVSAHAQTFLHIVSIGVCSHACFCVYICVCMRARARPSVRVCLSSYVSVNVM